jgi:hypothetical protein
MVAPPPIVAHPEVASNHGPIQPLSAERPPTVPFRVRALRFLGSLALFAAFLVSAGMIVTVLDSTFKLRGYPNGFILAGLIALASVGVYWRRRRIRQSGHGSVWNAPLAGALAISSVGVVGLQLTFWPQSPLQTDRAVETITLPVKNVASNDAGWVALFNGKDLEGWKVMGGKPGAWIVENGTLRGAGGPCYLVSDASYFEFHLKAEVRITPGSQLGMLFRTDRVATDPTRRTPQGFAAEITHNGPTNDDKARINVRMEMHYNGAEKTGSSESFTPHDWFPLELITQGDGAGIKFVGSSCGVGEINPKPPLQPGPIVIRLANDRSVLEFRKIEIKDLAPTTAPAP